MKTTNYTLRCLAGAMALAVWAPSHADSRRLRPTDMPASYTQECASCHAAYPPGMLPAASWQRIMGGLDRHYGTDATMDAAAVKEIGQWLQAHAGTYKRVAEAPPEDRITRSAWFQKKHDDVSPATWQLPSVRSAANCAACHTGVDQGNYDDDHLRFPAGLSPRDRRAWRV